MTTPHINQLRNDLMATLADLRNRENPMEVDRARAIAQVASVLVDTARVEVDYIKATDGNTSSFLMQPTQQVQAIAPGIPKTMWQQLEAA